MRYNFAIYVSNERQIPNILRLTDVKWTNLIKGNFFAESVSGIDFRRSIFVFLSNTGGREITEIAYKTWKEGKERESISYSDLEHLIRNGAFNEKGGLHKSNVVDRHLVDFYIPFLPLERVHVKQCIEFLIEKAVKETLKVDKKNGTILLLRPQN